MGTRCVCSRLVGKCLNLLYYFCFYYRVVHTFFAKETIQVIDEALETSPNPEKKKKILEKQKIKKNKAKEFYCSKVKDEEKCGNA